jgi:putative protein-disulfide isomerase
MLYYIHDPMCSWCYAFSPTWRRIESALPVELPVEYVLGGLAPDSDQPMPPQMREYIEQTWHRIQAAVPGTEFNFDFWRRCVPRRSTYPACRAVLTAKHFDPILERPMIAGIQRAYYREAQNPADIETLCNVAEDIDLNGDEFQTWMASSDCQMQLERELRKTRELGVMGFPSIVFASGTELRLIPHHYTDPQVTLQALERLNGTAGDRVAPAGKN